MTAGLARGKDAPTLVRHAALDVRVGSAELTYERRDGYLLVPDHRVQELDLEFPCECHEGQVPEGLQVPSCPFAQRAHPMIDVAAYIAVRMCL